MTGTVNLFPILLSLCILLPSLLRAQNSRSKSYRTTATILQMKRVNVTADDLGFTPYASPMRKGHVRGTAQRNLKIHPSISRIHFDNSNSTRTKGDNVASMEAFDAEGNQLAHNARLAESTPSRTGRKQTRDEQGRLQEHSRGKIRITTYRPRVSRTRLQTTVAAVTAYNEGHPSSDTADGHATHTSIDGMKMAMETTHGIGEKPELAELGWMTTTSVLRWDWSPQSVKGTEDFNSQTTLQEQLEGEVVHRDVAGVTSKGLDRQSSDVNRTKAVTTTTPKALRIFEDTSGTQTPEHNSEQSIGNVEGGIAKAMNIVLANDQRFQNSKRGQSVNSDRTILKKNETTGNKFNDDAALVIRAAFSGITQPTSNANTTPTSVEAYERESVLRQVGSKETRSPAFIEPVGSSENYWQIKSRTEYSKRQRKKQLRIQGSEYVNDTTVKSDEEASSEYDNGVMTTTGSSWMTTHGNTVTHHKETLDDFSSTDKPAARGTGVLGFLRRMMLALLRLPSRILLLPRRWGLLSANQGPSADTSF